MKIHINKQSEVPVREQLREQIIFLLGTGKLAVGSTLPSVRELARQLKIHYNTVSHVYADLVREGWLITRRGSRLVAVQQAGSASKSAGKPTNLDDLIDLIVGFAQEHAYSLQRVATRVRDRPNAADSRKSPHHQEEWELRTRRRAAPRALPNRA